MDLGIDGNAALVTAGTAGLGLASAEALSRAGADVAVCGRDEDRLTRAEAKLEASGGGDVLGASVDITDAEALEGFAENGGGTIVTITSRSVAEVIDDLVLSNSVRRAVIGLMKTLSREFAPEVRVNAVLPGAHETDRIRELVEDSVKRGDYEDYETGIAEWSEGVPLDRVGDPMELGEAVAWLSSERASYINGTAIPVDGGSMRSV